MAQAPGNDFEFRSDLAFAFLALFAALCVFARNPPFQADISRKDAKDRKAR